MNKKKRLNKLFLTFTGIIFAFLSCNQLANKDKELTKEDKNQFEVSEFPNFDTIKYPEKPAGPDWMHTASFYEIYPQSFYDTNNDGIGDLKGIIAKLDYVKSLGVDAIWINPFYVSPFRDAGYDIADYYHVDPRYGTDNDAKDLFRIANQKGLRILVDFVPGHTSIDHPWFKASCSVIPNKYSNWYIWTNGTWFNNNGKYKENFIQGYCNRDGNYMINFFWHQPALNYGWGELDSTQNWQLPVNHPDVMALRTEMKNIMDYWLNMGCSGFRVDMAGSLVKNDPKGSIKHFWQDVRKNIDTKYPDAFIISEWSQPENAINAGFHADFMHWFGGYADLFERDNSFFRANGKGSITHFLNIYQWHYSQTKGKGYISLPVGNHDVIRINNKERTQRDIEIIQTFAFTMPNMPFIYYGDEINMRQLYNIKPVEGAYAQRAGDRTPMQWDKTKNLGFSKADFEKLYLPIDTSFNAPTVAEQQNDSTSMLSFIRKLVKLHKTEPALTNYALFIPVYAKINEYPFVYMRILNSEKIIVVLNPSKTPSTAKIKGSINGRLKLLLGQMPNWEDKNDSTTINVLGQSYAVIKVLN